MRWLRALRMVLTIAAVAVVILFAASFVWGLSFEYGDRIFVGSQGVTASIDLASVGNRAASPGWTVWPPQHITGGLEVLLYDWGNNTPARVSMWMLPMWRQANGPTPSSVVPWVVVLPLWFVFLMFAVPCAMLWWFVPPRRPPGHCRKCGYDLRSLAAATKCPECGAAASLRSTESAATKTAE